MRATLTGTDKIDILNIGLMLLSASIALFIPFELFLFVYAVLGPLHYLTEISWLHDRNYFSKNRYDAVWLLVIGIALVAYYFADDVGLNFPRDFDASLMFIALLSALVFVTVKNPVYKIGGIVLLVFVSQVAHQFNYFFTVFVPTLIHVYVFTALFMIYGAIKNKARFGMVSAIVMVIIPFLLYNIYPDRIFHDPSPSAVSAYKPFSIVNIVWFQYFEKLPRPGSRGELESLLYHSASGVLFVRFVAFAYTYHYLNWFSKTRVIQWHNVPKRRFVLIIAIWLLSVALYMYNYKTGLQWLLFLSFMHVLLEFPLNMISIIGIGKHIRHKVMPRSKTA